MEPTATKYGLLRSGAQWEGITARFLEADSAGALSLASVPAPADGKPIDLPGPYEAEASGIALGACGDLFIADTAHDRVLFLDRQCSARVELGGTGSGPGQFRAPRGLAAGLPEGLCIADSGNGRVAVRGYPSLESSFSWTGGLVSPAGLAGDDRGRVYVLDRGAKRVARFDSRGFPDTAWNGAVAASGEMESPAFLALDAGGTLYVSDDATNTICRFDADGASLGPLPTTELPGLAPRCLATGDGRLYVADAATGLIRVFQLPDGKLIGDVCGYRGPVCAMAVADNGDLYVKPGMDDMYFVLAANAAVVPVGYLDAGPLDAGIQSEWNRLALDIDLPLGTSASLQVATTEQLPATGQPPVEAWTETGLDGLVPPVTWPFDGPRPLRRFLWLRLTLSTEVPAASPTLRQVRAETAGDEYIRLLPAIYRNADEPGGFLRRFLELIRSELGDFEEALDTLPARFSPQLAPPADLDWLAGWLGFELPTGLPVDQRRNLLLRVMELYAIRGTPAGLREMVRVYTGVRPHVVEAWWSRRIWQLGVTSALGFDTGLAPADPAGFVLPDPSVAPGTTPPYGCADERMVVGQAVVGAIGPLASDDIGLPLFRDEAHRFTVLVPSSAAPDDAMRNEIRRVIEAEKPAHTDYHLCFIEARMRVGMQSRIGIDSIIAGPPEPMELTGASLGVNAYLGGYDSARIGGRTLLGDNTILG